MKKECFVDYNQLKYHCCSETGTPETKRHLLRNWFNWKYDQIKDKIWTEDDTIVKNLEGYKQVEAQRFIQDLHLFDSSTVWYYLLFTRVKSLTVQYKISDDVYMLTHSFIHWTKIIRLRSKDRVSEGEHLASDSIIVKYVNILSEARQASSEFPAEMERKQER